MSDMYCYHCGCYHPREEMRLIDAKGGRRWRCAKSIEAARGSRSERDAYGRAMTERNRQHAIAGAKARNAAKADARSKLARFPQ